MSCKILVPLLITVVFRDVVQIVPADNNRASHFCRHNLASKDASTNRDLASERAFLVNISAVHRLKRRLDPHTNIPGPSLLLARNLAAANFGILEEMLFLVCLFDLSVSHGGVLRGGGGGVFGLGIC